MKLGVMGKELSALESFLSKDKRGVEWRTESLVVSERGVFSILGGAPFFSNRRIVSVEKYPNAGAPVIIPGVPGYEMRGLERVFCPAQ